MQKYTSISVFPIDELPDVYGYSEKNEIIRQAMINKIWVDQPETPINEVFKGIDASYKQFVVSLAHSKSDQYSGGLWDFNEHGLLSLISSQATLDCSCSNFEIEATTEEFAMALSIYAASMIANQESAPQYIREYFAYIYHLGNCIKSDAQDTAVFKKSNVSMILD